METAKKCELVEIQRLEDKEWILKVRIGFVHIKKMEGKANFFECSALTLSFLCMYAKGCFVGIFTTFISLLL